MLKYDRQHCPCKFDVSVIELRARMNELCAKQVNFERGLDFSRNDFEKKFPKIDLTTGSKSCSEACILLYR